MKSLLLLLFLICSVSAKLTFAAHSLIVDTDMNADDAIALLYLLNNKHVDIKAITVEANASVHCGFALKNLAGLLVLTKHQSIPIACGSETTYPGGHGFPLAIYKQTDTLSGTSFLLPKTSIQSSHQAVRLMETTLRDRKKPLDILTIGPQTNLAQMLQHSPELKNKIHRIYLLGGAIHVKGNLQAVEPNNKNNTAEWNIYFDPLAASIVFHSGVAIYLIPMDVTNQFPLNKQFYLQLKKSHRSVAGNYFYQILNKNPTMLTEGKWFFWDPLMAVAAIHPHYANFKAEKLRVVQFPEQASGTTLVDVNHGNIIHVCQSVNKKKFEHELLAKINL